MCANGEITFDLNAVEEEKPSFQIDYQNTMEIDQFLNSEDKTFSITEISNLLLSSSHYHKLYALRLISSILKIENAHNVFGIILCDKYTNVMAALKMISQTN